MNILADASLPGLKEAFPQPFQLNLYKSHVELNDLLKNQDILLCRANLKVDQALLANSALSYVATASSGSDNLDYTYLKNRNITVIDAKGCNATSVADYVLSTIAFLDKAGLIKGKKLGIVGLGYVGSILYPRLKAAGFELFCYDPPKALRDTSFSSCNKESLYECDVLCIHAELHDNPPYSSRNLINESFLQNLKSKCLIINASRGGIVNEEAIENSPHIYCTDVYLNEPNINKDLIKRTTLCTPHIAGHSLEAKYAAIAIVSKKIHEHLGLALPPYSTPQKPKLVFSQQLTWQKLALSLYNPFYETQLLKQSLEPKLTFLELRTQHSKRHDFCTYFNEQLSNNIKNIFI